MVAVFLAVYIAIATYYLSGILITWETITKRDPVLRLFIIKCPSAKWFASFLILVFAYGWLLGLLIKPLMKDWIRETLQSPIDKEKFRRDVGLQK